MNNLNSFLNARSIKDPTFAIYEDTQYIRASIDHDKDNTYSYNIDIPLSEIVDFDKKNHLLTTEESIFKIKGLAKHHMESFYNMLTDKTGLNGHE